MDDRALKVEAARTELQGAQFAIDLRAKQHMLVLGVSVTAIFTSVLTALAGQLRSEGVAAVALVAGGVILTQLRALRRLSELWAWPVQRTRQDIETLMAGEVDNDVDETSA